MHGELCYLCKDDKSVHTNLGRNQLGENGNILIEEEKNEQQRRGSNNSNASKISLPELIKERSKKLADKLELEMQNNNEETCNICFDKKGDMIGIEECGHKFCKDCHINNLSSHIEEGKVFKIACMREGC